MIILTDVDGVLLNWEDAFHAWMNEQGYVPDHKNAYEIWDCYKASYPELSASKLHNMICTFNSSATMGFLSPTEGAVYWIDKMHLLHNVKFHAITSMGSDRFAHKLRRMNLENIFGDDILNELTILPCGAKKFRALSQYKDSGLIWLEDNIENAVCGSKLGLKTFLFNRSYNQNTEFDSYFTRVDNWKQLYEILFPSDK